MAQNLGFPEYSVTLPDSIGFQLPEAKDSLKSINKIGQKVEGLKTEIEDSIPSIKVLEETEIIKVGDADEAEKALPELKDVRDISEYTGRMEGLQDKPQEYLEEIKESNEIRSAQGQIKKSKDIGSQAEGYTNEAKEISQGNFEKAEKLPQEVEKRVETLGEVQEIKKQAAELEALNSTPEDYQKQAEQYTDMENLKGQGKKQLKEKAIQHFAQHQDKLKAAMSKLSKKKKKFSLFGNGEGKKENPFKDKPFKERLYLGWQLSITPGQSTFSRPFTLGGLSIHPKVIRGPWGYLQAKF